MADLAPNEYNAIFWSGDYVVIADIVPVTKDGVSHSMLIMYPSEELMSRYPELVNEDTLNYETTKDGLGVFVKEYPEDYIIYKLDNPRFPLIIVLCNFDGSLSIDTEIQKKSFKLKNIRSTMDSVLVENERLREELKEARSYEFELKGGINEVQRI